MALMLYVALHPTQPATRSWWTVAPASGYTAILNKLDGQDILHSDDHMQAILNAGRQIHAAMDTIDMIVCGKLGVHRNELRCLHLLEVRPATPGEVAAHTGLTSGSVTALLDRLEAGGFVERRRSIADRRSVEIGMPAARLAEVRALYGQIELAVHAYFSRKQAAELVEAGKALAMFAEMLEQCATDFGNGGCPRA